MVLRMQFYFLLMRIMISNTICLKFLLIINFIITLILSLIIISLGPTQGFEISIYDEYPWVFWLLLLIAISIPFLLILFDKTEPNCEINSLRFFILLSAIMALFIFLFLSFLRGYAFYNPEDSLTHLGHVKYIELNNHFSSLDIYPIIHLWIYLLSALTNCEARTVSFIIPPIFDIFYVFSIFLLARSLKFSSNASLCATTFAILPIIGSGYPEYTYIAPSIEAFFLIPFTLYLLIRSRIHIGYSIALTIMLILYPFLHPDGSLFLLIIITNLFLIQYIYVKINIGNDPILRYDQRISFTPLLLLIVGFFAWFSSLAIFGNTIGTLYDSIILNLSQAPIGNYSSLLNKAEVNLWELIDLIIKIYGCALIYVCIAGIAILSILYKFYSIKKITEKDLLLVFLYITFSLLGAASLLKDLIISTRPIRYLLLFSTIIIGSYASSLLSKGYKGNNTIWHRIGSAIKVSFFVILIISLVGLSLISTYPSPMTRLPNFQVTKADFSGLFFFFEHRDQNESILEAAGSPQMRFAHAYYGVGSVIKNIRRGESTRPPLHFGYNSNKTLGIYYSSTQYLLIDELAKTMNFKVYPKYRQLWRYTQEDLFELYRDTTVDLIYSNSGIDIFEIHGEKH